MVTRQISGGLQASTYLTKKVKSFRQNLKVVNGITIGKISITSHHITGNTAHLTSHHHTTHSGWTAIETPLWRYLPSRLSPPLQK